MKPLITNSTHRPIDSTPQLTAAALDRIDALRPVRNGLEALGLDHHVSVGPPDTTSPIGPGSALFSLGWPLPGDGRGEAVWTASVSPLGTDGSLLSVSVQVSATDAEASQRVLTAWPLLRPAIASITTRLVRAVAELAEALAEECSESADALLPMAA